MDSSDSKALELSLIYKSDTETENPVTSQPNPTVSNSSSPKDSVVVKKVQPPILEEFQPIVTHTLKPNAIFKQFESEPLDSSASTNSTNSKDSKNSSASGKDSKAKGMVCFMKEELSANAEWR